MYRRRPPRSFIFLILSAVRTTSLSERSPNLTSIRLRPLRTEPCRMSPDDTYFIDSHLHVWSDGQPPYVYSPGHAPPDELKYSQPARLLEKMDSCRVRGALIVQPINHKYDHTFVQNVIARHPSRFKGMCLVDPTLSVSDGLEFLEQRWREGFLACRFNPYLWPEGRKMSDAAGTAMYSRAGELGMPVGFMCFKGLKLHYADIIELLQASPQTTAIIDHWGFFRQDDVADEDSWNKLLQLSQYPQVYVKVSACFRVSSLEWPYQDLQNRLKTLIEHFGSERLMWGSDYPFVEQHCTYAKCADMLGQWRGVESLSFMQAEDWCNIMRTTSERLFGLWEDIDNGSNLAGLAREIEA